MPHHRKTEPNKSDESLETAPSENAVTEPSTPPAEARVREAEEAALRATAELQNLKRRQREEIERITDTATKELVLALLPVVDDLERAIDAAGANASFEALRAGVDLTLNKLLAALRTAGVEKMPGVGEAFDPERYEAALQLKPNETYPSGTIAQELRSGYTQHGHVIRAGLVAVAQDQ